MKTITLFSQNPRTKGTTTTLPIVGEVTFDSTNNSIEVDEDKVEELKAQDFGLVLLTKDEAKAKSLKVQEVKTQLKDTNSILPLAEVFEKLKTGRSEEEKLYLNNLIEDLNISNSQEFKTKFEESEKMLKTLDEKELNDLLKEYPKDDVKKLNTVEKIIGFLAKKMVK